ncbi:MAG: nitroreductase family deazaflavin-dependent oxidoreductase, partial [Acidimicrobiales bacterium]|nr:nitroreductase family deazaflavin-dependent oxidoreductase [Acidimicrobiales bacterium]
ALQDGPEPMDMVVHEAQGAERAIWWQRAVEVFPTYADYEISATGHGRVIPVFIASPA